MSENIRQTKPPVCSWWEPSPQNMLSIGRVSGSKGVDLAVIVVFQDIKVTVINIFVIFYLMHFFQHLLSLFASITSLLYHSFNC